MCILESFIKDEPGSLFYNGNKSPMGVPFYQMRVNVLSSCKCTLYRF